MLWLDSSFQLKWLIAIVKSWNAPKFNLRIPVFQNVSLGGMLRSPSISMPCMLIMLCSVQVACVNIIMGTWLHFYAFKSVQRFCLTNVKFLPPPFSYYLFHYISQGSCNPKLFIAQDETMAYNVYTKFDYFSLLRTFYWNMTTFYIFINKIVAPCAAYSEEFNAICRTFMRT